MSAARRRGAIGLTGVGIAAILALAFLRPAQPTAQEKARSAIALLLSDPPAARVAHAPELARAREGLVEAAALERESKPLEAAVRLHAVAQGQDAATPEAQRSLLVVRGERARLLLAAGHSRQAALEAQRWAQETSQPSGDLAQLWYVAGEAQEAIGAHEQAVSDFEQALFIANKAGK